MLTPKQQQKLKDMAALMKHGGGKMAALDMLTNDIRRENPELHHTLGAVVWAGECPQDNAESLATRRFYHQPIHIDCYASYVVAAPAREEMI